MSSNFFRFPRQVIGCLFYRYSFTRLQHVTAIYDNLIGTEPVCKIPINGRNCYRKASNGANRSSKALLLPQSTKALSLPLNSTEFKAIPVTIFGSHVVSAGLCSWSEVATSSGHSELTKVGRTGTRHQGEPGFYHCGRKNCTTCQHSNEAEQFTSNKTGREFRLKQCINCHSSNIIYLLTCRKCGMQYVGETGRKLKERVGDHLRDIRNRAKTPVAIHFNSPGHDIADFNVVGVEELKRCRLYRKYVEIGWKFKIGSIAPNGLN